MIKRFIITEEEKKRILGLYKLNNNIISENLLLELGDGSSKTYDYKFFGNTTLSKPKEETTVEFTTDSGLKYLVGMGTDFEMNLYIDFNIIEDDNEVSMDYSVTDCGEIFKVMGTISNIVKKVLENSPKILGITYIPVGKENDLGEGRDKLFKLFIKNTLNKMGKDVSFDETKIGGSSELGKFVKATFI